MSSNERGEFITGDKLGTLTALFLKPTFAAVPVSADDKAVNSLDAKIVRTKIGSPYVIKAMNDELKNDEIRRELKIIS